MSGVFMDGGNHDGGHHGISHGIQMDSSQNQGAALHGTVGHGHGQGIIAHILGLDQNAQVNHSAQAGHSSAGHVPAQTPFWSSALQGVKIGNVFQGINITPNFLLLLLFSWMVAWLGVIYWIRHHEPLANQVLGSSGAYAPTAVSDRSMLHGLKEVFPVKTSSSTGHIYTPPVGMAAHADSLLANGGQMPRPLAAAVMHAPGEVFAAGAPTQAQSIVPVAASGVLAAPTMPINSGGGARLCSARSGLGMGPMGAMGGNGPLGGAGAARLFSARAGAGIAGGAGAMGLAMGGGARLFTNRVAQIQPVPVQAVQPIGWSLGSGSFSSDTAQFNSQFGAPEHPAIARSNQ